MEKVLFILFIIYLILTLIEIKQDERRIKTNGKTRNKKTTTKTTI